MSAQEEDFVSCKKNDLHQVDKKAFVPHKGSDIRVNVNIKQFSCIHGCDQSVRVG